jgi:tubulin epsilon
MNTIASNVLLNLTSGMRFDGQLNVDMNDLATNMVPYPHMHFLLPSMSPVVLPKAPQAGGAASQHRAIERLFLDIMSRNHQLMSCDPRQSMYLACAVLARGNITASDVSRNVSLLGPRMHMVHWNQEVRESQKLVNQPESDLPRVKCLQNVLLASIGPLRGFRHHEPQPTAHEL